MTRAAAEAGRLTALRDAPVGGQAVLEGVMMRGVANWAVAVRKPAPSRRALRRSRAGRDRRPPFPLNCGPGRGAGASTGCR